VTESAQTLAHFGADCTTRLRHTCRAGLIVIGLSDRWQSGGLGSGRLTVVRGASSPVLVVRGGLRPGGLAPSDSVTRYTRSLAMDM
jgi:hypothetical protein